MHETLTSNWNFSICCYRCCLANDSIHSYRQCFWGFGSRYCICNSKFLGFKATLFSSGDLGEAIKDLKSTFSHHGSDQIFEALLIAKSLGGSELLQILRTLGDFLRQDLALRREIDVKHGWIKNSAHISAAAPWILLLLLSTQPSTAVAYSTPSGALVLIVGLLMTAIAYLWMNQLGRLPQTPRVFIGVSR